ncbi:MAG: hypothetical protein EPO42_08000 [Gallionellaceae bacterium]|nr:MAG: hypothetical protein EPO42_08000 [Gallionellaceae bacterium]
MGGSCDHPRAYPVWKGLVIDVWGDAVNIASRLTDDAKAGNILADKLAYNRLRLDYLFEPPNVLNMKGKGEMTSYLLVGKVGHAPLSGMGGKNNIAYFPAPGGEPKAV